MLKDVPLRRMFLWTAVFGTALGLTQLVLITGELRSMSKGCSCCMACSRVDPSTFKSTTVLFTIGMCSPIGMCHTGWSLAT